MSSMSLNIESVAIAATAFAVCVGCGGGGGTQTFDVQGSLGGNAQKVRPNGDCVFPDGTYAAGEQLVLRGASNQILATSSLEGPQSEYAASGICEMPFSFKDVPAGEAAYQITIGSSAAPLVVPENTLRCSGGEFRLFARSAFDVLTGDPVIETVCSMPVSTTTSPP
jgi:hypothetical protein